MRQRIVERIKAQKVLAIVRMKEQVYVKDTVECLIQGGMNVLEITANTPGFEQEISTARELYPQALIGAGTITSKELALKAFDNGAQFLVTPGVEHEVAQIARQNDIPVLMGALTPSEIMCALKAGADIVKLFPAGSLGIDYCKALMSPFSSVPFFAVGGIDTSNVFDWLENQIQGVGLGSSIAKVVNNQAQKQQLIAEVTALMNKIKLLS